MPRATVCCVLDSAVLVPDTALLVPGAAGATDVLADVRAAALGAARDLVDAAPARVVVVAPGPVERTRTGPFVPSLTAAGLEDARLGWAPRRVPPDGTATRVHAPAASVALLLLGAAGWTGPVTLAEVTAGAPGRLPGTPSTAPTTTPTTASAGRAAALATLGRDLTAGPERVAVLAAGSLSARRGPDAPLAEDPRAAAVDDAVVADLADAGPPAQARLAAVPPELAVELAITAWAPWQVVLGAVAPDAAVRAAVRHVSAPLGAGYVVATWQVR